MAKGGRVGAHDGRHHYRTRWRHLDDRQHFRSRPPAGPDSKKGDPDHCLGRSRVGLTTKIYAVVDRQGLPIRLSLAAGQSHDGQAADDLLHYVGAGTTLLADKAYAADRIRVALSEMGAFANIPLKPIVGQSRTSGLGSAGSGTSLSASFPSSSTSAGLPPVTASSPRTSSAGSSSPQCDCGCAIMSLRVGSGHDLAHMSVGIARVWRPASASSNGALSDHYQR